jgi:hypothetical protein
VLKRFIILFLAGMVFFFVVNIISDICRSDGMDEPGRVSRYGFPFLYRAEPDYRDCFFNGAALAADIGIAMVVSASIAGFATWLRRDV